MYPSDGQNTLSGLDREGPPRESARPPATPGLDASVSKSRSSPSADAGPRRAGASVTAKLTYLDALSGDNVTQEKTTTIKRRKNHDKPLLADAELKKCLTIAELATGIKEMARALQQRKTDEAITAISEPLELAKKRYGSQDDPDVKRVVGIAKKYRDSVSDYHRKSRKKG